MKGAATVAALKRVVETKPTLFIDEADAAFGGGREYAEALRGLLNEGFYQGGRVTFCVPGPKDVWGVATVSVFCPKAIAAIGHLPDTVEDRSIPIRLRRRLPGETVEKFRRRAVHAHSELLLKRLENWGEAITHALLDARPEAPEELEDRASDVWEPLLAIADEAGGDWPSEARMAAVALSTSDEHDEESLGIRLLRDVRDVFDEERMSSRDLVVALNRLEASPWGGPSRVWGHSLDPRDLARLLKPYNIGPRSVRIEGASPPNPQGYRISDFQDAWGRYLEEKPDEADTSDTGNVEAVGTVGGPGVEVPF